MRRPKAKVGVFGIGLAAYWPQFHELKERLEGYQRQVEARIGEWASVESVGLVDDAQKAHAAGQALRQAGVDLVFCYVGTYATSTQVLPVIQGAKAPVVVLNLQPRAALDYAHTDTGEWLANCCACCVPEIAGAFARAAIPFWQVSGMLDTEPDVTGPSERAWGEIAEWCAAAKVVRNLRQARIGYLGHPLPRDAGYVQRLHPAPGATGDAHRGAGNVRPGSLRERRDGRRTRPQGGGNPQHL